MQLFCVSAMFIGVAILLYSIVRHYLSLSYARQVLGEARLFSRWSYSLVMALMIFFAVGYFAMGVGYLGNIDFEGYECLVAAVFFCGAVFVAIMVTAQSQMNVALSGKAEEIIASLVGAMEAKDRYTRGHSLHVAYITEVFYCKLPHSLQQQINAKELLAAAVLHDIGKIGVDDCILNKSGRLTDEEYEAIKQHPKVGAQIVADTSFSRLGRIILCHHERYDGRGYYGVPCAQIPLESQIIAIADTFSALTSSRVYRPAQSFDYAMDVIRSESGKQFDPLLASTFCEQVTEDEVEKMVAGLFDSEQPSIVEALQRTS